MTALQTLKADPRVLHVDDERGMGNGVIITLKDGYAFYDDCGVSGGETAEEALREMKRVNKKEQ